ncbi:MAG: TIGR03905 family TSCPD domain-containing protein [Clostridia bacterium]|nr:TIGR03905 family TSCPD domain-containing protein [Clostridia bacterium]
MESYSYKTRGTCSREIKFNLDGDIVKNVEFIMGCQGNTTGISRLVEGMNIDEAISRLEGINCGGRGTSCPDQLACALKQVKK